MNKVRPREISFSSINRIEFCIGFLRYTVKDALKKFAGCIANQST